MDRKTMSELLVRTAARQRKYAQEASQTHGRTPGQVFTPPEVAKYMASLLTKFPARIRILDPGAGFGILSLAVLERIARLRGSRKIELHLFETDTEIPSALKPILEACKHWMSSVGHDLSCHLHCSDFIAETSSYLEPEWLFSQGRIPDDFDVVIMNPPYFKLRKDSPQARQMARIVHGQPNAYALFLAVGARLLRPNGELVAISPRSFCNGLYFHGFRQWLFQHVSLDHVHLFESRTETFKESGVLQESVITKWHRLGERSHRVQITHSRGKDIDASRPSLTLPAEEVVFQENDDCVIRIPVSIDDVDVMQAMARLPGTFADTGLRISTGPVVLFRATELLRFQSDEAGIVPLLMPHNVKPFGSIWPIKRKSNPVAIIDNQDARKLLVPSRNYVLLKRFSAKEEKRRLTAGCLFKREQAFSHLGIENHLNYIYHGERELTRDETLGIACLFNSRLIDRYFRIISGNTQVNATEIRALRFPRLASIAALGRRARRLDLGNADEIEMVVLDELRLSIAGDHAA